MGNKLFLSPPDEFFNHQFALPHQVVASSDPGWRERYWVSIFDTVGQETVLSLGFGKYPNRDVMDGFAVLSRGCQQQNLRAARQLLPHNDRIAVGPFSATVETPLERLRFRADENASGLTYDLTWQATVAPALEGRHFEVSRGRISHDLVRYVQTGQLSGAVQVDGETIEVTPDRWWGVRDHSWGVRPMSALPGDPPLASVAWNFLCFCPIRFPSFSIHLYLFESQPDRPTHLSASILRAPGDDRSDDDIRAVNHDFRWRECAPIQTLEGGRIGFELFNGERLDIELRACVGRAFLAGGGYGSFQGKWHGASHVEHDKFDFADESKLREYNAHASDHLVEARCNGETGYGIIEYLIRRGYSKYGEAHRKR